MRYLARATEEFSSLELTFGTDFYFGVRYNPVIPQYLVKDPAHFAESAGDRLQNKQTKNTHSSLTQQPRSGLTCPGTAWESVKETISHTTRQETLIHSHLCSLSHCGLILGLKEWN